MMDIKQKFGKRIFELRKAKGMSQEALANLAEIDRTYISDIEKGDRNVSLVIIQKLSKVLEINISEIFKGI